MGATVHSPAMIEPGRGGATIWATAEQQLGKRSGAGAANGV